MYRNEPRFQARPGARFITAPSVWLEIIDEPEKKVTSHHWTDREAAGEMELDNRQKKRFQTVQSAKSYYADLEKDEARA